MTELYHFPLLSLLIWIPIIGAGLIFVAGTGRVGRTKVNTNRHAAHWIASITVIICALLSIPLYVLFNNTVTAMQFQENLTWIAPLGIHYRLGIDGVSLSMILLTNFTGMIVVFAGIRAIKEKVAQYMTAFLMLQAVSVGIFAATDAILFYVFWEAMLIPMYICIGVWGDKDKSYAAIKFFIYTFLGSALMLIALIYLGIKANSFTISHFYQLHIPLYIQVFLFIAFLLAFGVKLPMWPLHTWLPDAHTAAPAGGSVILAALMLKMGVYGFVRFNLPVTPDAAQMLDWMMIVLGLVAIVYIGFVALVQTDIKRLIAYSSIAHMGFATLACFMVFSIIGDGGQVRDAYMSLEGGIVQMISHAFNTGAMFLGVGVLYDRLRTRVVDDFSGVAHRMPIFAAFFMLFALSNVGLPGTSGFVGEFMIILSAFQVHFWVAFFASTVLVVGASYTLLMYKKVFFGPIKSTAVDTLKDIGPLDIFIYSLLAIGVLGIGIYPNWLLNMLHTSVHQILTLSLQHRV